MKPKMLSILLGVFLGTFVFVYKSFPLAYAASFGGTQISSGCINCHGGFDGQNVAHSENHAIGVLYGERAFLNDKIRPVYDLPSQIVLPGGMITCETCHGSEPHDGESLVIDNRGSALCSACHLM